ncbi:MAG: biosynthetic arginine decarboxylase [Verrucomicrobiota bacterium]
MLQFPEKPSKKSSPIDYWTVQDARELYGIHNWGGGFFDINEDGDVIALPGGVDTKGVSLLEVVSGLKDRGIDAPVLLRFPDILDSRLRSLYQAFSDAFEEYNYQGDYRGVYPIKVNQQQQVIEEITKYGLEHGHGLEAGSKAELLAALTYLEQPDALLVCNGYKDPEFVRLALSGQKLGIYPILVVETPREIDTILAVSEELGVRPHIGIRVKLSSKASGYWSDTGGDRSVFGLNTPQTMVAVEHLSTLGMLDCLELLHFHLGSQIPDIRDIRDSVLEACRTYVGLAREGASMKFIDLGGGLAVDYDGSQSKATSSANYSLSEYCRDVVEVIQTVMDEASLRHPTLITESGRATVAYYSVLLFNILDVSQFAHTPIELDSTKEPDTAQTNIHHLKHVVDNLTPSNLQESYNDAFYYRDQVRTLFKHGNLTLRDRSTSEALFWNIIIKIASICRTVENVPEDLVGIESKIADIYYGNFSVFQSIPDAWAIDQFFPIIPIHKNAEKPSRRAVISDITCDCDGRIDQFIQNQEITNTLQVHDWKPGDSYYLGAFLVGAYQETLGDLHNLLGDTNVVSVRFEPDGGFALTREIEGDSVSDVLSYVEYDPKNMIRIFREKAERAVRQEHISTQERKSIIATFEDGMRGYTYHEE